LQLLTRAAAELPCPTDDEVWRNSVQGWSAGFKRGKYEADLITGPQAEELASPKVFSRARRLGRQKRGKGTVEPSSAVTR